MNTLRAFGRNVLNGYEELMNKINKRKYFLYPFIWTILLAILTYRGWRPVMDYHWSAALIVAGLFWAICFSTVWMILRLARAERENWTKRAIRAWIFVLFCIGLSMVVVNLGHHIVDPLYDGLDAIFAILLGLGVMSISIWFIGQTRLRFTSQEKPNGNPTA